MSQSSKVGEKVTLKESRIVKGKRRNQGIRAKASSAETSGCQDKATVVCIDLQMTPVCSSDAEKLHLGVSVLPPSLSSHHQGS